MALVFQYGSNTSSQRFNSVNRLRGDAKPLKTVCTIKPFQLDFTLWSRSNNCAAADIVPGSGRTLWGVLYDIPDYLIQRDTSGNRKSLDAIEGEGQNYERIEISLRYRNGRPLKTKAITYVAKNRKRELQTSLKYALHIINGLREHKVPKEYINYVKKQVIKNNPSLQESIKEA